MSSTLSNAAHDSAARLPTLTPRLQPVNFADFAIDAPPQHTFFCDLRVTHEHLGSVVTHVNNIEYVRWLDRAAELHSDAAGFPRALMLKRMLMWFVARHEVDYLAEAWLDDELVIATWVRNFAKVKSWRDYVIVRPRDQRVICRAASLWVLVDLRTRRPVRIAQEMVDRFLDVAADPSNPPMK